MSRIEELAQRNLRPDDDADPCVTWDRMVSERMLADGVSRSIAVDRVLASGGSEIWLACQQWDAARPKILPDGTRSGNWLNASAGGAVRRVPRQP